MALGRIHGVQVNDVPTRLVTARRLVVKILKLWRSILWRVLMRDAGAPTSLRHSHQLEQVPIRVLKVETSATVPVVDLAIIEAPRSAAVGQPRFQDALENVIKLGVAHVKGKMMTLEIGVVVEQKGQRFIDTHRSEVITRLIESEAENSGEEASSGFLVSGRHNGVIQRDRHWMYLSLTCSGKLRSKLQVGISLRAREMGRLRRPFYDDGGFPAPGCLHRDLARSRP